MVRTGATARVLARNGSHSVYSPISTGARAAGLGNGNTNWPADLCSSRSYR
ncbi:hypothetical protein I552_7805 [Mycobacterium xenopi 3993]|nr:hypothetical protein I552_7805 [Mycobacterium xenopi 3993]